MTFINLVVDWLYSRPMFARSKMGSRAPFARLPVSMRKPSYLAATMQLGAIGARRLRRFRGLRGRLVELKSTPPSVRTLKRPKGRAPTRFPAVRPAKPRLSTASLRLSRNQAVRRNRCAAFTPLPRVARANGGTEIHAPISAHVEAT